MCVRDSGRLCRSSANTRRMSARTKRFSSCMCAARRVSVQCSLTHTRTQTRFTHCHHRTSRVSAFVLRSAAVNLTASSDEADVAAATLVTTDLARAAAPRTPPRLRTAKRANTQPTNKHDTKNRLSSLTLTAAVAGRRRARVVGVGVVVVGVKERWRRAFARRLIDSTILSVEL